MDRFRCFSWKGLPLAGITVASTRRIPDGLQVGEARYLSEVADIAIDPDTNDVFCLVIGKWRR
jgi:hypothetical protein